MAIKKKVKTEVLEPVEVTPVVEEGVKVVVNGITYVDTQKDGCTYRNLA